MRLIIDSSFLFFAAGTAVTAAEAYPFAAILLQQQPYSQVFVIFS
jgi:hypothetical protein